MKVTSLVENTANKYGIETEHGLSLYIETGGNTILFDMGQTNLFEENAKVLGIDLSKVDIAVLSHGHYDHGGGLKRFLEINNKASIYLSQYAFDECYHGKMKYIGLEQKLRKNKRLVFIGNEKELEKGIFIYSPLEKLKYQKSSSEFTRKEGEIFSKEDFRHELYLMIEEKGKKVLFSGCSHRGILEIAEFFHPDILIGGFHFSKFPLDDNLLKTAVALDHLQTKYYTCHCTGVKQFQFMKKKMKNLYYLSAGESITLLEEKQ